MAYRMCRAVICPLGVAVAMLAASETFAGQAAAGPFVASRHSISRAPFAGHHRRHHPGAFRPATAGFVYGTSTAEPVAEVTQPVPGPGEIRYTYSYDVPWDWAHRFPPMAAPSDRPYLPSCPSETVTVPGLNGQDRTVSIMRCY